MPVDFYCTLFQRIFLDLEGYRLFASHPHMWPNQLKTAPNNLTLTDAEKQAIRQQSQSKGIGAGLGLLGWAGAGGAGALLRYTGQN